MANKRLPQKGDKVKLINCKDAEKYKDRIFTVKASPYIMNRKLVAVLTELRGYYNPKHLEIVNYAD
jgi:hypothetical protein